MENFVVSARKYRPATFDTVVGQSHITTTLKNAIGQNHLAQAFLFCGPRGVGKTTCARILAKTINCLNRTPEGEACNRCESCVSFNQSASLNIFELDAASNNSVEDIRNLVDQVRYPPQTGRYKVYIIDEVHMLSNSAFNAFLKTLEEPPAYAIFILATTEKHKIIPTILSRCQIFDFDRIQINDISQHLAQIAVKEGIRAEEEALRLIAQKADGGLRDALSMFDLIGTFSTDRSITYQNTITNLHILDYDYYFKMTDALMAENIPQTLLIFDEILKKGFDGHNFIVGLCEHFRNLMVGKDAATVQLLQVAGNVQRKYLEQAGQAPMSFLLSAMQLAGQCDVHYKTSKLPRLHVELTLMKMAHITSAVNLAKMLQDGAAEVKKKPDNGVSNGNGQVPSATSTPVHSGLNGNGHSSNANGHKPVTSVKSTVKINVDLNTSAAMATAPTVQIAETPAENQLVTQPQVESCWQAFVRSRQNGNGYSSEQVILNKPIELNGQEILLKLDNLTQINQLGEFKAELLDFLRKELKNHALMLQAEVTPQQMRKVVYTNQEKFNYLAEKHPALLTLKQQLGLDVEY